MIWRPKHLINNCSYLSQTTSTCDKAILYVCNLLRYKEISVLQMITFKLRIYLMLLDTYTAAHVVCASAVCTSLVTSPHAHQFPGRFATTTGSVGLVNVIRVFEIVIP